MFYITCSLGCSVRGAELCSQPSTLLMWLWNCNQPVRLFRPLSRSGLHLPSDAVKIQGEEQRPAAESSAGERCLAACMPRTHHHHIVAVLCVQSAEGSCCLRRPLGVSLAASPLCPQASLRHLLVVLGVISRDDQPGLHKMSMEGVCFDGPNNVCTTGATRLYLGC